MAGTPGVKLKLPKDVIETILKETKGVISRAAKRLDISESCLRKKINEHPDLVVLLEELRFNYETVMLDNAEDCIAIAMAKIHDDPSNALKASFFMLNSKGETRGYKNTNVQNGTVYLVKQDPTQPETDTPSV